MQTAADTVLTVRIRQDSEVRRATLGRFRVALSASEYSWPTAEAGKEIPDAVRRALKIAEDKRTDAQKAAVAAHFQWASAGSQAELADVAKREQAAALFESAIPRVMVSEAVEPRETRILARGNWMDESGEVVQPAIPAFLGKLDTGGRRATRLDLANWLVSAENPLTARVTVNRIWRQFFGMGISKVLDDLGSQGEWPTHPELLDWLAAEFVQPTYNAQGAHAWDVKHLIRTIVTSRTYKQSSMSSTALDERDPDNRLLARQSRFRVEAETVRDIALSVSGLLVEKFGGPSVKPVQPDGYLATLNFPKREYAASRGDDLYRRGVYTFWQRSFLHPSLLAFDAPTREECTVNRVSSNTPLQALELLNDPIYVEAARVFAQNILRHRGNWNARVDWAFERAAGRTPGGRGAHRAERSLPAQSGALPAFSRRRARPHARGRGAGSGESAGRRIGGHDHRGTRDSQHARNHYEELAMNTLDIQRRTFLRYGLSGLGLLGLNSLMAEPQGSHGVVNPLHFPPKAKRVIFLYQAGGPSHLETFDYKPKLAELHGKPMPESFTKGQQIAQLQGKPLICFGPQYGFRKFGKCGMEMCELFPHLGGVADDMCLVRSMWTEQINHDPAHTIMNTGSILAGRPSMGSWIALRTGRRDRGSAGVRGPAFRGARRADAADRGAAMVGGPAAQQIPGREVELRRRRRAPHQKSRWHGCGHAEGLDRYHQCPESGAVRRAARPGDSHARGAVRDGVQDAKQRARSGGHEQGAAQRSGRLRRPSRRWQFRVELPVGAPPGRARRAFHPALPPRLGSPWRGEIGHRLQGGRSGQAGGGADYGFETARHAGRYAGDLRRGVRPHADVARR